MSVFKKLFQLGKSKEAENASFDLSFLNTDIHSHLIPEVDDGSKSLEKSLIYIKGLKELGYKKLITTPHIQSVIFKNDEEDLLIRLNILKEELKKHSIDIEIELAAEYLMDMEFIERIQNKKLLTFGNNHILVECFHSQPPINLFEIIYELQTANYTVVLAHPERYLYWDINSSVYKELRNKGVLFQMNILSLGGKYGLEVKKRSLELLKTNSIEFLGSDLHNSFYLDGLKETINQIDFQKTVSNYKFLNSEF